MLCYIKCTLLYGTTIFYTGNGNISNNEWMNTKELLNKPTFINIFKAKQIIDKFKLLDYENGEEKTYTYIIIPVLTYLRK